MTFASGRKRRHNKNRTKNYYLIEYNTIKGMRSGKQILGIKVTFS